MTYINKVPRNISAKAYAPKAMDPWPTPRSLRTQTPPLIPFSDQGNKVVHYRTLDMALMTPQRGYHRGTTRNGRRCVAKVGKLVN